MILLLQVDGAAALRQRGIAQLAPLLIEGILGDPFMSALKICRFLGLDNADPREMASQVLPRGPECLPYLLEMSLVDERSST